MIDAHCIFLGFIKHSHFYPQLLALSISNLESLEQFRAMNSVACFSVHLEPANLR